jgi:hypothetical protein
VVVAITPIYIYSGAYIVYIHTHSKKEMGRSIFYFLLYVRTYISDLIANDSTTETMTSDSIYFLNRECTCTHFQTFLVQDILRIVVVIKRKKQINRILLLCHYVHYSLFAFTYPTWIHGRSKRYENDQERTRRMPTAKNRGTEVRV